MMEGEKEGGKIEGEHLLAKLMCGRAVLSLIVSLHDSSNLKLYIVVQCTSSWHSLVILKVQILNC